MKASFFLIGLATSFLLSACQNSSELTISPNTIICTGNACALTPEQIEQESKWTAEEIAETDERSVGGLLVDYDPKTYDSMLGKEPFALFFHASWCGTCQFMEEDIIRNHEQFPEGSVIFKVDYDTETALKEKYEITSQSIVVMINANGSIAETLVAPRASTLAELFTELIE